MKKWIIEQTEIFERKFNKLIPKNLQPEIKKQIINLSENPFNSKPLGYAFLREKRIKKWRIYFLVYENRLIIYFIDLSDKKLQKETIKTIKSKFNVFKEVIELKYDAKK